MNMHNTTLRRDRGFTMIELMVVIAIIVLLVTLVAVSLKSVRGSARRTVSLSALKQIMMAYRSYSDDNRGQLLPGYIDADLFADGEPFENLRVTQPDGTPVQPVDAQSYVWRLAPYVDNAWEVFYTELRDVGLMAQLEAEYSCCIYGPGSDPCPGLGCPDPPANPVGISERPTYGLNSIFVGGDSVHGGSYATDRHPWQTNNPVIAATRFTQVKNPARLIVFGAAAKADASGAMVYEDQSLGFCELRPPFLDESSGAWIDPQWIVGGGGLIEDPSTDQFGTGIPIDRHGEGMVPVAHLDGSAAAVSLADLSADMRMWNPRGVGPLGLTPAN